MALPSLAALLATTAIAASVDPARLPIVVADMSYEPETHRVEFTLRKDGPADVIAWSMDIIAYYPDASTSREGMSSDTYTAVDESAAAGQVVR